MFCASRDIPASYELCPLIQNFGAVYNCVLKADISKGYQNPTRKWGVTSQLLEIIQLKVEKKSLYILCILTLFRNNGCLIISKKNAWLPTFFFLASNKPC